MSAEELSIEERILMTIPLEDEQGTVVHTDTDHSQMKKALSRKKNTDMCT
jgi:hypothetical protein